MKLEGLKVIDLSSFLPGPTVTQMMADHGAEVIKVENLGAGEPNRHIGQRRNGETVYFACTHRGKQSLTLNLKDPRGVGLFMDLARSADVVVESFRPGVVGRLGVGYEAVSQVKPDVVYASISAFGQDGPMMLNPAHDLAVEAIDAEERADEARAGGVVDQDLGEQRGRRVASPRQRPRERLEGRHGERKLSRYGRRPDHV